MNDLWLLLALGTLHVFAIAAGGGLIWLALRGDAEDEPDERDDDGGLPARLGPDRPLGGPPLPSAGPARMRLRGPGRLSDGGGPTRRRGRCAPARPRVPARGTPR